MDQCWYEVFDNKVRYDPSGKCSPEKDFQERNWMTFRQLERKRGGQVNYATSTDGMNTLAYLTLKVTLRSGRRNVSQCHPKQSLPGLHSPGLSYFT